MRFVQIHEQDFPNNKKVIFHYTSEYYYEVSFVKKANNEGWIFDWTKKKFPTMFEKTTEEILFQHYKVNTEYYIVINEKKEELGVLVIGKQDWNNVLRVWDLYVMSKYQRKGIGTQLMDFAKERAKTWGCRALVLDNPVSVHDFHATIMHLLGIEHERLTYRYQGRDFRLTDVEGNAIKALLV